MNKWDKKIEVFENEYFFDTPQDRRLALRDFAKEVEEETLSRINKKVDKIYKIIKDQNINV